MKTHDRFKYGTIQGFVEARRRRSKRARTIRTLAVILAGAYLILTLYFANERLAKVELKSPSPPILAEAKTPSIEGPQPVGIGNEAVWLSWHQATDLAVKRWRSAGIWWVDSKPLRLVADPDACLPVAIACSALANSTIYVSKIREDVDRTTIMMHEVGHLLGVPHIQGDVLMDAEYQGEPLDAPTPAAVALAKQVHEEVAIRTPFFFTATGGTGGTCIGPCPPDPPLCDDSGCEPN